MQPNLNKRYSHIMNLVLYPLTLPALPDAYARTGDVMMRWSSVLASAGLISGFKISAH